MLKSIILCCFIPLISVATPPLVTEDMINEQFSGDAKERLVTLREAYSRKKGWAETWHKNESTSTIASRAFRNLLSLTSCDNRKQLLEEADQDLTNYKTLSQGVFEKMVLALRRLIEAPSA